MSPPTRIAITPGEPSGVGPELTLKLAQKPLPFEIVAIANINLLNDISKQLNLNIELYEFDSENSSHSHLPGQLSVIDVAIPKKVSLGTLDVVNAEYVMNTLSTAIDLVSNKTLHAITTGPVQKSIINEAGITFSGHTEYLANITGGYPVMMLTDEVSENPNKKALRVALVTTHIAISNLASQITSECLEKVLTVLNKDLVHNFKISNPRICVCGLNPHAGEDGHLGTEEILVIQPIIKKLQQSGMNLFGPEPADTAFAKHNLEDVDVVLAMYHDQGLPVIKHAGFGNIVNVTLGLPIIRTSVDHGTALNLAGKGTADESSMYNAACLAAKLAQQTNNT